MICKSFINLTVREINISLYAVTYFDLDYLNLHIIAHALPSYDKIGHAFLLQV